MNIFSRVQSGLAYTKNNTQLWYTIAVAIVIFASFFFIVDRFVTIAEDSAERLVNVRIGSLQDAFVSFARDDIDEPVLLQEKIAEIAGQNETIEAFMVVKYIAGQPTIFASLDEAEVGESAVIDSTIAGIVQSDPANSFTLEQIQGDERFFQTARAITDDDGAVVGLVITRQSLSEADRQIDRAIQDGLLLFVIIVIALLFLFFRFARIIDYATLYRRLKEVDQLKDDFIAMASHELRSPLATIRGYIELIRDAKGLSKEQDMYAHRVELSAANLNDLVADMLDVSRLTQGRMKFEYTDFNIEEEITNVVESFQHQAQKKGLTLKSEALREVVIHMDRDKVHRVLVNLVSNAIKYTKEGSVTISHEVKGEELEIRISDTGIGISREDQEKLFERFYRVRSAETESIQGTGLGLWLSREIMREQGGDITVESIKGVGTHMIITIPLPR